MAKQFSELIIKIGANTKEFESSTKKIVGVSVKAVAAMTAALVAGGAASLKAFSAFQSSFSNVITLLDDASFKTKTLNEGIDGLREGLLDLRAETGESFESLNKGLFDLISAGVDAEDAIDALRIATNLALTGATDTAVAVDGLTSAMNAYSLEADDAQAVSEKFFTAQKFGKTTIEELAKGFGLVAPNAQALGISLDELLASVSAVTTGGIKTNQAYTGMAAILANVIKPTADAVNEAKRLGIEFNSTALRTKGLNGFLKQITESAKFNKTSLEKLFSSVEATKTIFALTGAAADDFDNILGELADTEKSAITFADALTVKQNDQAESTKRLKGEVERLAVKIGAELSPRWIEMQDTAADAISSVTDNFAILAIKVKIASERANFAVVVMSSVLLDWAAVVAQTMAGVVGNWQAFLDFLPGVEAKHSDTLDSLIAKSIGFRKASEAVEQQGLDKLTEIENLKNELLLEQEKRRTEIAKEQQEKRLEDLLSFYDLSLEEEAIFREKRAELKREAKEEGDNDLFDQTEEEFEENLEQFTNRLNSVTDIELDAFKKRFDAAKTDADKRKLLEGQIVGAKKERFKAESELDKAIADSAFAALSKIVGDNKAAQTIILIGQKAMAISRVLMAAQQASILAYGSQLIIGDPTSIVRAEAARQYALTTGNIQAAIVAATAIPEIIGTLSAQQGGIVPGGFGGGDRVPMLLEPGEVITPERLNPLSPNFDEEFGGGVGGGQNVNVIIGLEEDASQVLTVQQREDTKLGIQR